MYIVESYKNDSPGSTFVGYLRCFDATGKKVFTLDQRDAIVFKEVQDCPVSELQNWEIENDGSTGYYRLKKVDVQKIPGIDNQVLNKILRKKILWTEIKAKEQEYLRIGKQIRELEDAQKDISFAIQKRIQESQDISEWLDDREYEALKKEGL